MPSFPELGLHIPFKILFWREEVSWVFPYSIVFVPDVLRAVHVDDRHVHHSRGTLVNNIGDLYVVSEF